MYLTEILDIFLLLEIIKLLISAVDILKNKKKNYFLAFFLYCVKFFLLGNVYILCWLLSPVLNQRDS